MGWAGTGNGALLGLAADSGFDALLTVDRGFAHQQNQDDLPLPVVIMLAASNRPDELRPLVPKVIGVLSRRCKGASITSQPLNEVAVRVTESVGNGGPVTRGHCRH